MDIYYMKIFVDQKIVYSPIDKQSHKYLLHSDNSLVYSYYREFSLDT